MSRWQTYDRDASWKLDMDRMRRGPCYNVSTGMLQIPCEHYDAETSQIADAEWTRRGFTKDEQRRCWRRQVSFAAAADQIRKARAEFWRIWARVLGSDDPWERVPRSPYVYDRYVGEPIVRCLKCGRHKVPLAGRGPFERFCECNWPAGAPPVDLVIPQPAEPRPARRTRCLA